MKNRFPSLYRLKPILAIVAAALLTLGPTRSQAQYSIQGQTCVWPGSWIGPYTIVGGAWSSSDKWCVDNGSTLGGTTNTCIANQGSPSVGVTWATHVTTSTLSYYHPGTATTPVATLTVTIQDPGSIGSVAFVPSGIQSTVFITGTPVTGCFAPYFYSWLSAPSGGTLSLIGGQSGQSMTITGTWTSATQIVRQVAGQGSGSAQTNPFTIVPEPPFSPGTVTPGTQSFSSGTASAPLNTTTASGGVFGPNYNYIWQSSTDNINYSNIGSSSSSPQSYSPGVLTTGSTMTTYYYRVAVTTGPLTMYTNAAVINVYPPLTPGNVTPGTNYANLGGSPGPLTLTGTSGCCGSYSYVWQSSPDNSSWAAVGGAPNAPAYTPTNMQTKTWYRVLVTGGNNVTLPSGSAVVNVLSGVPAADNQTGDPNTGMNWVLTTGYDASGNILRQSKKFYDYTGNLAQAQDKVFYRHDATTIYPQVLASQPVNDAYGRAVLTTLAAPIDYADFNYAPNFITAGDGSNYNYKNFDLYNPSGTQTDKTNSPDPIGGQGTIGTLGWYYGASNFWEPYLATTNYPYTRQTIYRDGTNLPKKNANAGESLIMGSNHEAAKFTIPVVGEFTHYMSVRNKFFSSAQVGNLAPYLLHNAVITVTRDGNGNELFTMSDKSGKVLMTARAGSDLTLNCGAGIAYPLNASYGAFLQGTDHLYVNPSTTPITVTQGATTIYSGPASGFNVSTLGTSFGAITCAIPFEYQTCPGGTCSTMTYATLPPQSTTFKILADNTPVSITGTGSYTLYDMNTESPTSMVNGMLNRGFYKVVATGGVLMVNYTNSYTDISYNFYNQLGQLIATIAPNGVKQLITNGINTYPTLASIPFVSLYNYDAQGRLISSVRPDAGTTTFVYTQAGKLRFSQNALQISTGAYSYTNFDAMGRIVESGQYQPDAGGIPYGNVSAIVENTNTGGGLGTGTKTDVSIRVYDIPDATHSQAGYAQDAANLGGLISTSMRYSSILNNSPNPANLVNQTWYNYDEEGKMVWVIKYNPALGVNGYKTWDYSYDALNNLTTNTYQKNVPAETFVHHYVFDPANGSLWKVYTATTNSTDPNTWTLQATYIYYLHGPLKRVELAGHLQGIDLTYTLQGALKAINNNHQNADPGGDGGTNGFMADQFGTVLDYYQNDYTNTKLGVTAINGVNTAGVSSDSYAGNLKAASWYSEKPAGLGLPDAPLAYLYNYDQKYQLKNKTWATNLSFGSGQAGITTTNLNKEAVIVPGSGTPGTPAYDGNGNILNLTRTDGSGNTTDQFAYSYPSTNNQLQSIVNTASGTAVTFASYTYDALGREVSENLGNPSLNKYIRYNLSGKVSMVARDAAFTQPVVQYVYDEMGTRIEKLTYNSAFQLSQVTYYFGGAVYTQQVSGGAYGSVNPPLYQVDGGNSRIGVYNRQSGAYEYELTDHQGNVRVVLTVNSGTSQVTTYNDYYPFGMTAQNVPGDYRYDYQGKYSEKDGETGWNNFDLRMYNARIGRWFSVDPASQGWSPYAAMNNNPVNGVDPDGGWWQEMWNLITNQMWISNAGLAEYRSLQQAGLDPNYQWVGSRVKGHGDITWVTGTTDGPMPSDLAPITFHNKEYQAVQDEIVNINGQLFAIYPDLQLTVTGGLRTTVKIPLIGKVDINLFSVDLYKYSFADNTSYNIIQNPDKMSVSSGASAEVGGLGVGYNLSYGGGKLELGASVTAGGLTLEMTRDMMNKEAQTNMNAGFSSGDVAVGAGIVFESKFVMVEQRIPNNDVQAWVKKSE